MVWHGHDGKGRGQRNVKLRVKLSRLLLPCKIWDVGTGLETVSLCIFATKVCDFDRGNISCHRSKGQDRRIPIGAVSVNSFTRTRDLSICLYPYILFGLGLLEIDNAWNVFHLPLRYPFSVIFPAHDLHTKGKISKAHQFLLETLELEGLECGRKTSKTTHFAL